MKRKYHLGRSVSEDLYKVDLQVFDRYLAFSTETLRIASLGLAGYGFLVANVLAKGAKDQGQADFVVALAQNRYLLATSAMFFAFALATALANRYYATECLTHFVRGLRLRGDGAAEPREDGSSTTGSTACDAATVSAVLLEEDASLEGDLTKSKWTLRSSITFLGLGAVCAAWAIAAALVGLR